MPLTISIFNYSLPPSMDFCILFLQLYCRIYTLFSQNVVSARKFYDRRNIFSGTDRNSHERQIHTKNLVFILFEPYSLTFNSIVPIKKLYDEIKSSFLSITADTPKRWRISTIPTPRISRRFLIISGASPYMSMAPIFFT